MRDPFLVTHLFITWDVGWIMCKSTPKRFIVRPVSAVRPSLVSDNMRGKGGYYDILDVRYKTQNSACIKIYRAPLLPYEVLLWYQTVIRNCFLFFLLEFHLNKKANSMKELLNEPINLNPIRSIISLLAAPQECDP